MSADAEQTSPSSTAATSSVASQASSPQAKKSARKMGAVIVVLILGGLAAYFFGVFGGGDGSFFAGPDVSRGAKDQADNAEIAAPSNAGQSAALPQRESDALQEKIDELELRLATVNLREENQKQILADLSKRMASVENELKRRSDNRLVALASALMTLQNTVVAGEPFQIELRLVEALAPAHLAEPGSLAALRVRAKTGIKRAAQLSKEFDAVARQIMSASTQGKAKNWWDDIKARFASLISIRPVEDAKGMSTGAIVTRMQMRVDENDIAGAVKEADALKGAPAMAAKSWRDDARAYIEVHETLNDLSTGIARELARSDMTSTQAGGG